MTRRELFLAPAILRAAATKPRVACVLNAYFPNSHSDVFLSRLLGGYRLNGETYQPRLEVASLYVDQFPFNDMAKEQAGEYGFKIYPTVSAALRLGGDKMAVDGVAVIGEHGSYPRTRRGSVMYPRHRYFEQIARVMREDGRVVPLFNDKYFAYEWDEASSMYKRVREMRIPFMAGSTVPLTWQKPPLQLPGGSRLEECLAVGYGDLEEHAYHAVEMMQSVAERRGGGETGVAQIRCVEGEQVWKLASEGEWSEELFQAALSRRRNPVPEAQPGPPQAIQVRYADGLKATILNLNHLTRDFLLSARAQGRKEPYSTCFHIEPHLHNHWGFMVQNFEDLVLSQRPPTNVERTLLATGITLFALESRVQGQKWLDTPQLAIRY